MTDKIEQTKRQKQAHKHIYKLSKILKKKGIPVLIKNSQEIGFAEQILSEKVQLCHINEDFVRALFDEELKWKK